MTVLNFFIFKCNPTSGQTILSTPIFGFYRLYRNAIFVLSKCTRIVYIFQGAEHCSIIHRQNMRVNLRCFQTVVAQRRLYGPDAYTALHEVRDEAMTQRVWSAPRIAFGVLHRFAMDVLNVCLCELPLDRLFTQFQVELTVCTIGCARSFHFGGKDSILVGMISRLDQQMGVANGTALAAQLATERAVTAAFNCGLGDELTAITGTALKLWTLRRCGVRAWMHRYLLRGRGKGIFSCGRG